MGDVGAGGGTGEAHGGDADFERFFDTLAGRTNAAAHASTAEDHRQQGTCGDGGGGGGGASRAAVAPAPAAAAPTAPAEPSAPASAPAPFAPSDPAVPAPVAEADLHELAFFDALSGAPGHAPAPVPAPIPAHVPAPTPAPAPAPPIPAPAPAPAPVPAPAPAPAPAPVPVPVPARAPPHADAIPPAVSLFAPPPVRPPPAASAAPAAAPFYPAVHAVFPDVAPPPDADSDGHVAVSFFSDLAAATTTPAVPSAPLEQHPQPPQPQPQPQVPLHPPPAGPHGEFLKYPPGGHSFSTFACCGRLVYVRGGASVAVYSMSDLPFVRAHPLYAHLASFPGPLTASTPQGVLARYVEEELPVWVHASVRGGTPADRVLLVRLLLLMLRNGGALDTSDHSVLAGVLASLSDESDAAAPAAAAPVPTPVPTPVPAAAAAGSLAELERQLCGGDLAEALETAVASGQWAVALILATHVGGLSAWSETMQRFAATFPASSTLRTAALVAAGRWAEVHGGSCGGEAAAAAAVAGGAPVALDRWRANVAAVLNLTSSAPAQQRKTRKNRASFIEETGDRLWRRGNHVAAHCCYLLAEREPAAHDDPYGRIVLLAGNSKMHPSAFVSAAAVELTEILELCHALGVPQARCLAPFQHYKVWYAGLLLDMGLVGKARAYLAEVEATVYRQRRRFSPLFVAQLHDMLARVRAATPGTSSGGGVSSWVGSVFGKLWGVGTAPAPAPPPSPRRAAPPAERSAPSAQSAPPAVPSTPFSPSTAPAAPASSSSAAAPAVARVRDRSVVLKTQPHILRVQSDVCVTAVKTPPKRAEEPAARGHQRRVSTGGGLTSKLADRLFGSLFSPGKNQADLGVENQLVYNEELKMWVRKTATPEELAEIAQKRAAPPPPLPGSPTSSRSSSLAPPPPPPPPSPLPAAASPAAGTPHPPRAAEVASPSSASGRRRLRYVDPFSERPAARQPPLSPSPSPLVHAQSAPSLPASFSPLSAPAPAPAPSLEGPPAVAFPSFPGFAPEGMFIPEAPAAGDDGSAEHFAGSGEASEEAASAH